MHPSPTLKRCLFEVHPINMASRGRGGYLAGTSPDEMRQAHRDRVRNACLARVRQRRGEIVARLRRKKVGQSPLRDILAEEVAAAHAAAGDLGPGGMAVDEAGAPAGAGATAGAGAGAGGGGMAVDEVGADGAHRRWYSHVLTPDELSLIYAEMERELDMERAEAARVESALEQRERLAGLEARAMAASREWDYGLPCPVCKLAAGRLELDDAARTLSCSCGLRAVMPRPLTKGDVRAALEGAMRSHTGGCLSPAAFEARPGGVGGSAVVHIVCARCGSRPVLGTLA